MLNELKNFIATCKDDKELAVWLAGNLKGSPELLEVVLESEEVAKRIESRSDKIASKNIENYKKTQDKATQEAIDSYVKEHYPEETPVEKRLREVEKEMAESKRREAQATLMSQAIEYAQGKGLPIKLVKHLVGDDIESTKAKLMDLEDVFSKDVQSRVEEKFKEFGREPKQNTIAPSNGGEQKDKIIANAFQKKDFNSFANAIAVLTNKE